MKLFAMAVAAALLVCAAAPATATIDITVAEVGSDVVFSYAGALDVTGATVDTGFAQSFVFPQDSSGVGAIGFGGGSVDRVFDVTSFPAFGTGGFVAGSGTTGPGFAVFTSDSIGLPFGYVSDTPISGSLTIADESMASLGLIGGVYQTGSLPSGDFVRLTVPEPASALLCLWATAALASSRRRG
jgi:hypothetical protein